MAKRRKKGSSYTPKAEDRHWYGKRQTARSEKSAARTGSATTGARRPGGSATPERPQRRTTEGPEIVTGRNPVVEALRAGVPASTLYVMSGASDDRIRESIKLATDAGVPLLEAVQLDRLDRLADAVVGGAGHDVEGARGHAARRASTTGLRPVTISGPSVVRRWGRSGVAEPPGRRAPVVALPVRAADFSERAVWRLPYPCRSSAFGV